MSKQKLAIHNIYASCLYLISCRALGSENFTNCSFYSNSSFHKQQAVTLAFLPPFERRLSTRVNFSGPYCTCGAAGHELTAKIANTSSEMHLRHRRHVHDPQCLMFPVITTKTKNCLRGSKPARWLRDRRASFLHQNAVYSSDEWSYCF